MACNKPKCKEARAAAAALKAGRGPSVTTEIAPKAKPEVEYRINASGGITVSTKNKKGIVQ